MGSIDKPNNFSADVIVIGSGSGGAVAALTLANAGKRVIVIEEAKLGGNCVHSSCIPTKALLETASSAKTIADMPRLGINVSNVRVDYKTAMHWQQKAVHTTGAAGNADSLFANDNIHVVTGRAHFIDAYTVSVNLTRYTAPSIIIASGASPRIPDIHGLINHPFITYKSMSTMKKMPKSIAIIGGGATGYEYAQIFRAFGTVTHLFETHHHLFSSFDPEVGDLIASTLGSLGVHVHTGANITQIKKAAKGTVVTFQQHNQQHHVSVDAIFVAAGHIPNTDIGLENAQVTYSSDGIKHNRRLQTSQKHIFAIGDVTGASHSASSAIRQGQVAAHNILHRKKVSFDTRAVPRIAYGVPEVIVVGQTERDMKLTGLPYQTAIAPLGIISRSFTSAYASGFVKVIATHTGIVTGASIVAPHAAEFGQELTFAIQHRHRACDIANTIHPFSSWSEAVRVAASKIYCI